MKNSLLNLAKIPPKVSVAMIAASLFIGYVSTLRAAIAFDLGEWMRDSINDQYKKLTSPDKPAQQLQRRIEAWQRAQCPEPQPLPAQPAPVQSLLPDDRLVQVGNDETNLTDPIAIELFKIAPGTLGRVVLRRVGYPISSSQKKMSDYYDTADGRIAVKYKRQNKVSRVVSVDFVR